AIVGAGPAGFFAADQLLKSKEVEASVDLFERWPTPYGLVREGVAPDHQSIKGVTRIFDRVLAHPRVRLFGNVQFGEDVTREELRALYDQVVYAVGAQTDRRMGIPGEDLAGSWPATDFVRWYNGQPECVDLEFDLDVERAVVIGNGNVAVDVARILLTSPDVLAKTDIAEHALDVLRGSAIREVVMVGRRGPVEAKFTNVELKELGALEGVDVVVDPEALPSDLEKAASGEERRVTRNLEILSEFATRGLSGAPRRLVFRFLASPVALLEEDGRVEAVRLERNRLVPGRGGALKAEGTGAIDELEAGLVLRSVGYHGVPLPDLPFDSAGGVIPNCGGRVLDAEEGDIVPGEYVTGWIKRGPSGVIGTNKACAAETVAAMLEDAASVSPDDASASSPNAVVALLDGRGTRYVTAEEWCRLNAEEVARGEALGRPRVKLVRVEEMLSIIGKGEQ
ncbi:MAG: FAD-dependent oxidoreductase, partial [marine benthic group bacterium]|nr:FAD-dependent oxidoreductase [Gemmatimonadota bacterium]